MKKTLRLVAVFALMGATLAYTGCTDYSKDFDDINNRIEALESGKLKSVEEQVAGLKSTVASLEDAKKKAEDAIAELQKNSATAADLKALEAKLDAAVKDAASKAVVDDLKKKVESLEAELAKYAKVETLNAEIEKLNKAIADAKALSEKEFASINDQIKAITAWQVEAVATLGAIDGRVKTLEDGLEASQEDIKNLVEGLKSANAGIGILNGEIDAIYDELNTAWDRIRELTLGLKATTAGLAIAEENIATLQTDMTEVKASLKAIKEANYLTEAKAAGLYQTEAQVKEAIKAAIEDALANEGVISVEIAKAVKTATDNLQSQIDALKKNVAELADRIQSIVYVPEFANGAKAYVYKLGNTTVAEYTKATFKVTPAKCAAALDKKNTKVLYAETKAADYTNIEIASLEVVDEAKGLVEVAVTKNLSGDAFAIGVKKTNLKAEESGIETGADITSDFAPVAAAGTPGQIENMIVLYNATTNKEYAAVNKEMGWDKYASAEAEVAPFDGFAPYVKEGTGATATYSTIDEFKAAHYITTDLAISYGAQATYTDNAAGKKAKDAIVVMPTPNNTGKMTVDALDLVKFNIGGQTITKTEDVIPFVGTLATVALTVKCGTLTAVNAAASASYKIVNRQVNYDLIDATEVINWTYKFVDDQSSAHTVATYLDKDLAFAEVDFVDQNMDPAEFNAMLAAATPTLIVKKNGTTITNPTGAAFQVTPLTSINHKTAKVVISGKGMYDFGANNKNVTYTYCNKYTVPANNTDYNVRYSVTFGPKPSNEDIPLGAVEVPYSSAGFYAKPFAADNLPSAQLFKKVSGFADIASFKTALFENTQVKTSKVKRGTADPVVISNNQFTYLNIGATGEFVRVSTNADMQDITDTYSFETKFTTWWGPVYKFTADASVTVPNYSLSYVSTWADNTGKVIVPGHVQGGVYVINNAKLNTYVKVNKASNPGVGDVLKVKYTVKTQADANKGIANVPAGPYHGDVNLTNNSIDGTYATVVWGNYTARELDLDADLYIVNSVDPTKMIKLATLPIKLVTEQVVKAASSVKSVYRPGNAEVSSNFWQSLTINCDLDTEVVSGETQLVNFVDYTNNCLKNTYVTKYGLAVTFKDVKVFINEIDKTSEYSTDNYNVNLATGAVTLYSNEATLLSDVTIQATAVIRYDRDYNGKDALERTVSIKFTPEPVQE